MAQVLRRAAGGFVCQPCQLKLLTKSSTRPLSSLVSASPSTTCFRSRQSLQRLRVRVEKRTAAASAIPTLEEYSARQSRRAPPRDLLPTPAPITDPPAALDAIKQDISRIVSASTLPTEADVTEPLERILQFSAEILDGQPAQPETQEPPPRQRQRNASSSILSDLDEVKSKHRKPSNSPPLAQPVVSFHTKASETLSEQAYKLLRDPKVAITNDILELYVRIQCHLNRPQYLPEIFYLFANKPIPKQTGDTITFTPTRPWLPTYEIPLALSSVALDAAIDARDMPLCIAIIDTTVTRTPHLIKRWLRQALPPLTGVGVTLLFAYACADWLSTYQNTWDPRLSKLTTMMGATAYIGTMSSIGFVAIATWNDHMVRLQWTPGTGLWDRFMREDERAYLDRVAQAWGFKEKHLRGEEQGEEWEALREVCGIRSITLDMTSLLEGME